MKKIISLFLFIVLFASFVSAQVILTQLYDGSFRLEDYDQNENLVGIGSIAETDVSGVITSLESQNIPVNVEVNNLAQISDLKLLSQKSVQLAIEKSLNDNKLRVKPVFISAILNKATNTNTITGSAIQNVPSGNWNFIVGII